MDFYFILYILVCILVGGGVVNFLYKSGQTTAALLSLGLLVLIYVFYYLRWFSGTNSKGVDKPASWPPIVNMCPDFMTLYKSGENVYCYDVNDTYLVKGYPGGSGFLSTGMTINSETGQSALLIKNNSANTGASSLQEDAGGARWPIFNLLKNSSTSMTGDERGKFIRWEGVYDGRQINVNNAPLA